MSAIQSSTNPPISASSRCKRLHSESGLSLAAASRLFWMASLLHATVWTLLPGLLHSGYRLDVIEQLFIGREWVLASSRHPAFPMILLQSVNVVTGRAFLSPFLTSQLCALATVWGVWRLARMVLTPMSALAASLSMVPYWFFTIDSTNYNQNLPYIAFWTLTIVFVFESLRTDKTIYWMTAGICIGFGLFSKFSMILLVVTILIYFVCDANARKTWKSVGPWLSTLSAALAFLPIPLWMFLKQDWAVPEYIAHPDPISAIERIRIMLKVLLGQIGIVFLPLLVLLSVTDSPFARKSNLSEDQRECFRFLSVMILLPLLFHILFGLFYLDNMLVDYGAPLWPTLGILVLLAFKGQDELPGNQNDGSPESRRHSRVLFRLLAAWLLIESALIIAFVVMSCFATPFTGKPHRFQFPMVPLGKHCEKIWDENVGGQCPFVTGEWWLAGNAAEGMRPSPRVHAIGSIADMDFDDSPTIWSSDEDVNRHGGLILWTPAYYPDELPETLFKRFPQATILTPLVIPYEHFDNVPPVIIGVAIVKPENLSP